MVSLAARAVVLVRFPFSDLSHSKLRPAVVLADSGRGDWLLCQITSPPYGDVAAVPIEDADLEAGSLRMTSYARPGKLFTAGTVGQLNPAAHERLIEAIVALLRRG